MPKIIIGTDVVNFPDNGSDALWSPAVIQFAELVSDELLGLANPYDIIPTVFILSDNSNPSVVDIGATFDSAFIRKFSLSYAIYRVTDSVSIAEAGTVTGVYNTDTGSWTLQDEYIGDRQANGKSYHSFSIDPQNRIILTIEQLAGTINATQSKISFSAKTELVSN